MSSTSLSKKLVEEISERKKEPTWMLDRRLKALEIFERLKLPVWGPERQLKKLDFNEISYYIPPENKLARNWEDVPEDIRNKYDALGIPEGEQEYLAGLGAQFESEMIYHSLRKDLKELGIIFEEISVAVRNHPELIKQYFGSVIKTDNNKFSALNGAVWSGGSFVFVPRDVTLDIPLHNFFQMSTPSQGQFERTLIVADEGSSIEFLEGCVAPLYSETSLHAGVVEIVVKKGAQVKYSTMQNWSKNVMNLVTKGSYIEEEGAVEWVDGNVGSGVTMKYPSMVLAGPRASGTLLSVAFASDGQVIDSGGKAIHLAPETSANIESKSVVRKGGETTFRGDIQIKDGAENARTRINCVSLHMDEGARSSTYPRIRVDEPSGEVEHESSVTSLSEEQLLYLKSRGISEQASRGMVIGGFIDPFTSRLPMEYAVEFTRLVELEIENGMG